MDKCEAEEFEKKYLNLNEISDKKLVLEMQRYLDSLM